MKRLATIIIAAMAVSIATTTGSAAQQQASCAFRSGEEIGYTASYSAAIVSTDVADITFRTTTEKRNGVSCYKIEATGRTRPFYSVFFKMEDVYRSWIATSDLRPVYADMELKEGSYRYRSGMTFDWNTMRVTTVGRNLKRDKDDVMVMPIGPNSFDAVSLFFNMRNINLGAMKVGVRADLSIVLTDTVRTIQYRYVGKEIIDTESVGAVRCLKVVCQLATTDGESFAEGSEFTLWISDDNNRIPIYLETPIRVGRVQAVISSYKGLAHPFTSRVKVTSGN